MAFEVVAVRLEQKDAEHDHVSLIGYHSSHIAYEPIMLSATRVLQRIAIGDRFFIKEGDQEVDLVAGSCPVCGETPYIRTKADSGEDQKLMALPIG